MIHNSTITTKALGERLRIARSTAGKTQDQAARFLGVARTTIVAIESGDRRLKDDELVRLASLYAVSISSLLRDSAVPVDLRAQFRRTFSAIDDEVAASAALRTLQSLATSYVEIERLLSRPLLTHYPPEYVLSRGSPGQQAEDLGVQLRSWLGVGSSPIPDIVSLLELEFGMRIFIRPLDSRISGVFAFDPSVGACILLNSKHPRTRRGLTAAHELVHFMIQRSAADVCLIRSRAPSPTERFADLAAGTFLMPQSTVRRSFTSLCTPDGSFSARQLILLAHAFHVSHEAMCRRLEDLELLPRGTFDMLREQGFDQHAVRTVLGDREPDPTPPPLPPRFSLLVAEAAQRGLLSEGQLADMLLLDRLEVRRLIEAFSEHGDRDLVVKPY